MLQVAYTSKAKGKWLKWFGSTAQLHQPGEELLEMILSPESAEHGVVPAALEVVQGSLPQQEPREASWLRKFS